MSRSKAKRTFTVRAGSGEYGLIPGSMGTGSYVVKGDLVAQTAGVECREDAGVIDEIPGAYKDLGAVIEAQSDLVEVARLTTLMCVKG